MPRISTYNRWICHEILWAGVVTHGRTHKTNLEDYGIDWGGPVPLDPEGTVDVPEPAEALQILILIRSDTACALGWTFSLRHYNLS